MEYRRMYVREWGESKDYRMKRWKEGRRAEGRDAENEIVNKGERNEDEVLWWNEMRRRGQGMGNKGRRKIEVRGKDL